MKYRITNIVNADVIIEDLSIRLAGKGSSAIVDANTADRSKDLIANCDLIRIDKIREMNVMPIWPFVKPKSEPHNSQIPNDVHKDMDEIKSLLANILLKIESKPKSESITEKHIIIQERSNHSDETPEPMFIPSKITPDKAETDIKLREGKIFKNDLSKGVEALKKLRSTVK